MADVLVIEDDAVFGRNLCDALAYAGHSATWSRTAEEGLRAARALNPQAVLIDLVLPQGSGRDVLRRLRADGSAPALVMMTAHADIDSAVGAMKEGADDFLVKSSSLKELVRGVERVLLQRRLDSALRESERRLAVLIANLPGVVYRCAAEPSRRLMFISEGCRDLVGRTADELLAGPQAALEDLVHLDERASVREQLAPALHEPRAYRLEYRILQADGKARWVLDHGSSVFGENGAPPTLQGFLADVTDRHEAQLALIRAHESLERRVEARTLELREANSELQRQMAERAAAERRFRELVESAPDAIAIVDAVGTVELVNVQMERLFGYAREDLIGRNVDVLVPTRFRGMHVAHRARYFADPGVRPAGIARTLLGLHRDGSELPVEISLSPLHTAAGLRVCAVIRDVRERLRIEEEIRRHQMELAHAARVGMMGELAAGLAHELNQPLCAIVSNAQAVRRMLDAAGPRRPALEEALEDIIRDGQRGGQIIRHLRDFLKKAPVVRRPVGINEIVRDLARYLDADAARHGTSLQFELADGLPPALGDRIHLQQVILNLARNAMEAMEDFPAQRRLLRLITFCAGDQVGLSVRDQGPGLSAEVRARLFEPFFTTKRDGLGMGLAISRSIVEAHGGRLEASADATGSTFTLFLPTAPEDRS